MASGKDHFLKGNNQAVDAFAGFWQAITNSLPTLLYALNLMSITVSLLINITLLPCRPSPDIIDQETHTLVVRRIEPEYPIAIRFLNML